SDASVLQITIGVNTYNPVSDRSVSSSHRQAISKAATEASAIHPDQPHFQSSVESHLTNQEATPNKDIATRESTAATRWNGIMLSRRSFRIIARSSFNQTSDETASAITLTNGNSAK